MPPLTDRHPWVLPVVVTLALTATVLPGTPSRAGISGLHVPAGLDLLDTTSGTFSFADQPIPAGFFGPSCPAFDGLINFEGVPTPGDPFNTDTVVQRLGDMSFSPGLPDTQVVDIEIVELSLQSVQPFVVNCDTETQWDVSMGLSSESPSLGQMQVTQEHPNGGTFTAGFQVKPVFVFQRLDAPVVLVHDTGLGPGFPVFIGTPVGWHTLCPPGFENLPPFCPGIDFGAPVPIPGDLLASVPGFWDWLLGAKLLPHNVDPLFLADFATVVGPDWFDVFGNLLADALPPGVPVVADFDGDGLVEIAIFDDGHWFLNGRKIATWGKPGDIPFARDLNGDGIPELITYRPATGRWFFLDWLTGAPLPPVRWGGRAGDLPMLGDHNGDGATDLLIVRNNGTILKWFPFDLVGGTPLANFPWGIDGDIPIPIDRDCDGFLDPLVWRQGNGRWFEQGVGLVDQFGQQGMIPIPGFYDDPFLASLGLYDPLGNEFLLPGQPPIVLPVPPGTPTGLDLHLQTLVLPPGP